MDSVGIGELPDSGKYGDTGSNTLGNISLHMGGLKLINLQKMGLGNIDGIKGFEKSSSPEGCFGKMAEKSAGKDTTTGHWEMSGIVLEKPFPVHPNGFPEILIRKFETAIGTKVLGNITASGTEIIKKLGKTHMESGYPIVYTSADSVFQIASHENVIPFERLYDMCKMARTILVNEHAVGRVIARPFIGSEGAFVRTANRKDFSLNPFRKTILDYLSDKGYTVAGVGKIEDIFNGQGITKSIHTRNNKDSIEQTLKFINMEFDGLIFTNLVDFDMNYGHRNDVKGYANALIEFDSMIPDIEKNLHNDDILIITADHGCDPTTSSTDHTREYVPLLINGKRIKDGVNLGIRNTFADISAFISDYFKLKTDLEGTSFLQ